MQNKKVYCLVFVCLFVAPLLLVARVVLFSSFSPKWGGQPLLWQMEQYLREALPGVETMRQFGVSVRYIAGEKQQQGIYMSDHALLKDIEAVNTDVVAYNNRTIHAFAEGLQMQNPRQQLALLLIPTASAVSQQYLPLYASPVNQRNLGENIHNQLADVMQPIDVYHILWQHRDDYIYYRTENQPTMEGGYYIYEEIAQALLPEEKALPFTDFDIGYGAPFYGDIYNKLPYNRVQKDIPMFFYSKNDREIVITHSYDDKKVELFYSPYVLGAEQTQNLYFGGMQGKMEIISNLDNERYLLVIGDTTAASYLPFLMNHYEKILFVNIHSPQLTTIHFDNYDQILFAVSLESYLQKSVVEQLEKNQNLYGVPAKNML